MTDFKYVPGFHQISNLICAVQEHRANLTGAIDSLALRS